ncbi:MAG: type II secretion system secretin GspD [Anaeromyxobacter sp.]|nr:type II secretion system secretin GspD [Anaeromyxobacter sp.]MBL0275801.1 type II secretion system secretin GspD [Anaeromyxobacter sp.]
MRSLLATLCLAPALAAAQAPIRPPRPGGVPGAVAQPVTRPTTPRVDPRRGTTTPEGVPINRATGLPAEGGQAPFPGGGAAPATPGGGGDTISFTPVKAGTSCQPIQGKFLLAFNKADVVDILEQASRWTCRNFIYGEDVAKGKITLLSKSAVSAEEAYAAFLAALSSNGIALYQTGKYWKLVRTADAKKTPIPTYTTDGETPSTEQPITKLIRLKFADADQVRGVLGNFISPQGADLQTVPPDLLIITDIGLNIRRIERLLETLDRAGAGEVVRMVQIRYAAAKDIADKVNQIFAQGGAKGARKTVLASPATPARPAAPGAPAAPASAGGGVDVQVTKVIPDDRTNKLIIIADEKSFERILELVQQLDVPTAEEGGIHVVYLKNAAAEDLASTLSNLAQGKSGKSAAGAPGGGARFVPSLPGAGGSPAAPVAAGGGTVTAELFTGDVKITADKAQNALVIQASGADIVTVRRLIDKLDRPRRQVFVEAVIMEVNLNNSNTFGVGAHGAIPFTTKDGSGFVPINLAPGRISTIGQFANVQSLIGLGGFLTGYAGPVSASLKDLGLNIPSIGVMVQALQSNSDVNVISTPHILASDNEESEITVGQNVPFQAAYAPSGLSGLTSGASGTTGAALGSLLGSQGLNSLYAPIQRQPVELRLKIKPQISEGDNIRLVIDQQTEEIVDKDPQLGPTTAKRSVKTQIVAKDQSTIVIGGLIQERNVRSVKKVPFLGSLPILGWLFRDTTTTKTKTNLLIFLTPYIIRDEADYRRIYEKKRKEQQDFTEQFYGRQPGYDVAIDFTRKTGPYSLLRRDVAEETARPENGGAGGPGERVIGPDATPSPPPAPPGGPGAAAPAFPAPLVPAQLYPVPSRAPAASAPPEAAEVPGHAPPDAGGLEPVEVTPEGPPADVQPPPPALPEGQ